MRSGHCPAQQTCSHASGCGRKSRNPKGPVEHVLPNLTISVLMLNGDTLTLPTNHIRIYLICGLALVT